MPIESFAAINCSVARPMSILGERWTVLVLRELFLGRRRFDEMQSELGIATNVLSQRLSTLVDEGIAERHLYSEHPDRYEYRLTDKGLDLLPVIMALLAWGDRYTAGKAGPPLEMVHRDCGHVFHMTPTCDHCGEEIKQGSVKPQLGPGATKEQRKRAEQLMERRRLEREKAA